jgi:hypothetical protein
VKPRALIAIAVGACAACCLSPLLAGLGAVAAFGLVSTLFIGVGGLVIAAGAVVAAVIVRRRSRAIPPRHWVPVELSGPPR